MTSKKAFVKGNSPVFELEAIRSRADKTMSAEYKVFSSAAVANPIEDQSIGSRHLNVLTQTQMQMSG